ncbi:DUF2202 domain-containing protein [uncultured Cohaesibacter sp.]|uniref:ferritin-like domain-containing protein n=1 Tax=uncultured Cohaesibacter sp. TaxID=1002546 RepID=UPI0029C7A566|nr:DUF2202 domain-containing protein [uncultured Cohaesibacter sp.]
MTTTTRSTIKAVLVSVLIAAGGLAGPANAADSSVPQPVAEALATALQDEYHAEAFYDAVMEKFGAVRPFANIIRAEQMHQAILIDSMTQYGVDIPANTELKSAGIRAAVPVTLAEACAMGVTAEIDNAGLYTDRLLPAVKGYADITAAFTALSDASQQKHLPAFQRCAAR